MKEKVNLFIGQKINSVQTGVGSIIYIGNDDLFFTIYCSWRLRKDNKVLVNWYQEQNSSDSMASQLELLLNSSVSGIYINDMYDLTIQFDNDMALDVFTDISDNEYGRSIVSNWDFVIIKYNVCYSVDFLYNVNSEPYE